MKLFKNRTVVGVLCILLSLVICFVVTPMFNASVSEKATILRVAQPIRAGEAITEEMLQAVEVGAYNLPDGVYTHKEDAVGLFATADLAPGDYLLPSKLTSTPTAENEYLYGLDGERVAISVTIKSFSLGLSGKLMSGDIVSIIAPDYKSMGVTLIPPELQYVEVISVTASSGYDANTGEAVAEEDGRELPTTVTLLVLPEQARVLAELEADSKLHMALAYRGSAENAALFIAAQQEIIEELLREDEDEYEDDGFEGDVYDAPEDADDTEE